MIRINTINKRSVSPSSNFLESTGDNEIGMIHGNKISSKLAREVVLLLKFFPVNVRFRILCLLKGMSNGALEKTGKNESLFNILGCKAKLMITCSKNHKR